MDTEFTQPSLLLHTCCAPCFSSVEEQLRNGFSIDIYWYNPNIYPLEEYQRRLEELKKFAVNFGKNVTVHEPNDCRTDWANATVDYSQEPEGKRRCGICIGLRLDETARYAKENDYSMFSTTLTVSPHKNATLVNALGNKASQNYGIPFLEADFKKNNGYLRSIELSKQYGLYRQNYCGCIYSMNESLARACVDIRKGPSQL